MNVRRMLYIIGAPGVGKSTILAEALKGVPAIQHAEKAKVPMIEYPGGVQLGVLRPQFSGTDGMSMSIQPKVLDFLYDYQKAVVAEGDRLANDKFFEQVLVQGWRLEIVLVKAPWPVVEARRQQRAGPFGAQDPGWVAGRETKVRRLADRWHPNVLEAGGPPAEAALFLTSLLTIRMLRGDTGEGGLELPAAQMEARLM